MDDAQAPVLSVRGLTKRIRGKPIVEDLTFAVERGEIFGFLGPNGAGKTTTIRMLVGLIRPTAGSVTIGGYDIRRSFRQAMRQVGSIVENPALYPFLTGWENLRQFSRMLGDVTEERMWEVVDMVRMRERIHDRVKTYSLGMKQRLGIAQALLNRPSLLILDEPTNGLDPAGIREMRSFIRRLVSAENISVFVSSHLLSEVQMLCHRVAIIKDGRLLRVDRVQQLMEEASEKTEWLVDDPLRAKRLLERLSIHDIDAADDKRLVCRASAEEIAAGNRLLTAEGVKVYGIRPLVVTLEDLFMEWTGGKADD